MSMEFFVACGNGLKLADSSPAGSIPQAFTTPEDSVEGQAQREAAEARRLQFVTDTAYPPRPRELF
jgi:hypothetical protein